MNKQILTDIVNSILGLSKKKKKEFVELLDDSINGVSEQLNEAVEEVDRKINNIEPSDFEENDETKSSFIKNRPFYDYETDKEFVYKEESYENNINGNTININGSKHLALYVENNDLTNIKICIVNYITSSNYNVEILNSRYKLESDYSEKIYDIYYKKVVNYYNNESLILDLINSWHSDNTGDHIEYQNNCELYLGSTTPSGDYTTGYLMFNSATYRISGRITPKNYENGKLYIIDFNYLTKLKYYKGEIGTEHHFKSLDEKYIPNSLIQRIEACEQALNITPNP